jgi:ferredoxin-NADP reductase
MTYSGAEVELDLEVVARTEIAAGVVHLALRDRSGAQLPPWQAGAHIDLHLGERFVRQYSLCGDPAERDTWRVSVLHEPGGRGGSAYLHERVSAGSTVRVRGPRNHFVLAPAARYEFIAGGIGITPILPMVAAAQAAGARWQLTYGGRTRSTMAFADQLAADYPDHVTISPQDETGLLDLDALLSTPQPDILVYCCGPEPLLAAVEARCAGWPPGALHVERFAPKEIDAVPSGSFEVELATTGRTFTVPADRSILETLEAAGVAVLSSCREGTCGTCETTVLAGVPEHRDSLLTEQEKDAGDTMMICVSRASSPRLVLER